MFLIQSSVFLRSFHCWKNENFQRRTNALSSRLFYRNFLSNFVIQERLEPVSNRHLKLHLQFFKKVRQVTAKLSERQNFPNFDVFHDFPSNI